MFNARKWIRDELVGDGAVTAIVPPERIFQTLMENPDERPFVVIRFNPARSDAVEGMTQDATIWIHDDPLSYVQIDTLQGLIRNALEGPINLPDGISCYWQGDSDDLSDDERGTAVRNSSYRMVGRK
jgi:hypothetical protein